MIEDKIKELKLKIKFSSNMQLKKAMETKLKQLEDNKTITK